MKKFLPIALVAVFICSAIAVVYHGKLRLSTNSTAGSASDNDDFSAVSNSYSDFDTAVDADFDTDYESFSARLYKITYKTDDDSWNLKEEYHEEGEEFYLMPSLKTGNDFLYYVDEDGNKYYAEVKYSLSKDLILTPIYLERSSSMP